MKRLFILLVVATATAVCLGALANTSASEPERVLVLLVRVNGFTRPATFSGRYQFDTNSAPIQLDNRSTPFGVKMKAKSLKASFQKTSDGPDLLVELLEFSDEKLASSVAKTGASFDIDARTGADQGYLNIR